MKNSLIAINTSGGFLPIEDLKHIFEAMFNEGSSELLIGSRQQLLLNNVSADNFILKKIQQEVIDIQEQECVHHNIMSSHFNGRMSDYDDWAYSDDCYPEILMEMKAPLSLKLNLVSHLQTEIPFFSGNLNFITTEERGLWALFLRFPGSKKIALLPMKFLTFQIPETIKIVEDIYKKEPYKTVEWHSEKICDALKIDENQLRNVTLPKLNTFPLTGFSKMKTGKLALNMFHEDKPFSADFLQDVYNLAKEQSLTRIYMTANRSFFVKNIKISHKNSWEDLLAKHNIKLHHNESSLCWSVNPEKINLMTLKKYLVTQLEKNGITPGGIKIALSDNGISFAGNITIQKQKSLFGTSYNIYKQEDFDLKNPIIEYICRVRTKKQLTEKLIEMIAAFKAQKPLEKDSLCPSYHNLSVRENAKTFHTYQCQDCQTDYKEEFGDSANNIASGILFVDLPEDWTCPLCEQSKSHFSKLSLAD